ncbi:MAG: arsenosugar biosynthesis radical SAM protein ArsS [Deltaproteobacteria bacterium]|nr:arsenosugar biosynthesis radical SAM protein ArsS [Deltaproteobacteria bacterium]
MGSGHAGLKGIALMTATNSFEKRIESISDNGLWASDIETIQVNVGLRCNQQCTHCHVEASPHRTEMMEWPTMELVLDAAGNVECKLVDLTGGAPELNPHFRRFVEALRKGGHRVQVRTNLTVLLEAGMESMPEFFRDQGVQLVASLPCYRRQNVCAQRGEGVYEKSVEAMRRLNTLGYGIDSGLPLHLVYNPIGPVLPPEQSGLEADYRRELGRQFGITFTQLMTIANMPIGRFLKRLQREHQAQNYMRLLQESFNSQTLDGLMCRHQISIRWDGTLYDCDFNLALGSSVDHGAPNHIRSFDPSALATRRIVTGNYCFGCTAGYGSSCGGALVSADTKSNQACISVKDTTQKRESVKEYYGRILSGNRDLKTSACCSTESLPSHHRKILQEIDGEILSKFYGCGSPIPLELEGYAVLDLGCGTGRDVYLASRLVGPDGFVVGVDMTDEQLDVARRHVDTQTKRFGLPKPNVEFKKGYIEDLSEIGIADNSVDVVVSNCVINLSPDKRSVFSEIFRVLKPGGELYFADIFSGRRIPDHLGADPVLSGECLAGALYVEDFRRLLREIGWMDYRVVSKRQVELKDPEVEARVGMIDFYSMTIRAFKLPSLEDICEDYGQTAIYLGTLSESPHRFVLDDHHTFVAGKPMLVCGNTAAMIDETRFARHFKIIGNRSTHYGPFDCGPARVTLQSEDGGLSGSCC